MRMTGLLASCARPPRPQPPKPQQGTAYMRMTALLASRSVDVMRPAAQPLLQVAASGLLRAPAPLPACALAALRRASSSRSHLK